MSEVGNGGCIGFGDVDSSAYATKAVLMQVGIMK